MSQEQHSSDQPITTVAKGVSRVSCNGGGGALGHPQIWLTLTAPIASQAKSVTCPYCSHHFAEQAD